MCINILYVAPLLPEHVAICLIKRNGLRDSLKMLAVIGHIYMQASRMTYLF